MHPQGRYRTPLLIVLALLLVFSVLSLSLKRSPALRKVQGLVVSVTAPGLEGLEYVGRSVKQLWLGYFYLVGVRQENVRIAAATWRSISSGRSVSRRPSRP